jgi:hypothetical protein
MGKEGADSNNQETKYHKKKFGSRGDGRDFTADR